MNVTVLQENDKMWIAADSYPLVAFNKDKKKFQESAQLFFPIDDKIIFCSGNREVINNIMLDYMPSNMLLLNKKLQTQGMFLRQKTLLFDAFAVCCQSIWISSIIWTLENNMGNFVFLI